MVDLNVSGGVSRSKEFYERLKKLIRKFWERGSVTLWCSALSFLTWLILRKVTERRAVVFTDISLVCLVLLFRAMKDGRRAWTRALVVLGLVAFFGAAFTGIYFYP